MIAPGKTIGVFGGGQLGRKFALAARRMGYRIHVYEPGVNSPAGQVADIEVNASYRDEESLLRFLEGIDVATFEFENIPADFLQQAALRRPVHPSPEVLLVCQNREREKLFLRKHGFPHAPFAVVTSAAELKTAMSEIGASGVLKTADFGYDGKGQARTGPSDDPESVWNRFNAPRGVFEKWIDYAAELSAICAIGANGQRRVFPVSENIHTRHILEYSIAPARLPMKARRQAAEMADEIARALGVTGLLAVEFFLTSSGDLLVNELAPRPHNSGHYSFDGCLTSQFEQHLRAVCGLPLGSPELLRPTVMCNLLGDLWARGIPNWSHILDNPAAKLHLYGKEKARPDRKMGHFCILAETAEIAFEQAFAIKRKLIAEAGQ